MVKVYKLTKPIQEFYIQVDKLHKIWVQESGNPNGIPILCLHGGPGYPMSDLFRILINPKKFRIITFHQRGCGLSTPAGSLVRNKTRFIIQDIETIRKRLNIDKWIVKGCSWGATLAVAYAEAHPKHVMGLIIFGLSLFRNKMENVTIHCAPDVYDKWKIKNKTETETFKTHIKNLKQKRVPETEYEIKLFKMMDFENIKFNMTKKRIKHLAKKAKVNYRIGSLFESYYYTNNAFMKKNQLLKNASRLNSIPGFIIHGRFDIICDPSNSYELSKHWKRGKLEITPMAGHSLWNVNNSTAIQNALKFFSK